MSRRKRAGKHKFVLPVSKALGCKRTGTESDPLQMLARLYLLPIYSKRDNPTPVLTLGGNRLLAGEWERATWRGVGMSYKLAFRCQITLKVLVNLSAIRRSVNSRLVGKPYLIG